MFNTRRVLIISSTVILIIGLGLLLFYFITWPSSCDWPMWRYDANRSASSPQKLPDKLYLQWVREYPKLTQVWKNPLNRDLMQYDKVYEPVVLGDTLFVGSNVSDRLVALDTETGEEKWRFYVDGPVRFPPVASNGKVYFVSDDGYLYCLDAEQGKLIWKFCGAPSERKTVGNERLISTWSARGGPVLKDGTVYFAAGIWPLMGVFVYALDAETGDVVWENDSTGSIYMLQPHGSPSYAGVAPQGNFVVDGDKLLVPCGRSVPACFDRQTGKLLYYHLAKYNKTGGAFVCALGDFFVNYHRNSVTSLYRISDGHSVIPRFGKVPVMTEDTLFSMGSSITAYDFKDMKQVEYENIDIDKSAQKIETGKSKRWVLNQLYKCNVDASGDLIKAGTRLYAGGKNVISAVDIPGVLEKLVSSGEPEVTWKTYIEGTAERLIAADNKLFVVTLEGNIYAFSGEENPEPKIYSYTTEQTKIAENVLKRAESILQTTEISDGYCLAYGVESGELVEALCRKSNLHIIAVTPDSAKVNYLRRKFDKAGLYGKRVSVHAGTPLSFDAPSYLASLTVFENWDTVTKSSVPLYEKSYRSIRPYGGVACFPVGEDEISVDEDSHLRVVNQQIQKSDLPKAKIQSSKEFLLLIREGSLPGSDDWTHQYGDIANTVKSDDKLVKLPLGILWFGGSSNMDVLPRHGHGPPEQVIGGRLFIEGIDCFSARDVYTGRVLWKRTISDLNTFGTYYGETYKNTPLSTSYNQVHIPGANARGTNFVATLDKVYIVKKNSCLVLDSATGKTVDEFKLPPNPKTGLSPQWGYIGVCKDYLIAGAGFVHYLDFVELDEIDARMGTEPWDSYNFDISSSKKLVIMNRHTGEVIWTKDSELGFRHNGIAVGDEKIFCIDTIPTPVSNALKRRLGEYHFGSPKLMALNLHNGKVIWNRDARVESWDTEDVSGTWLSYSKKYDILLQGGRNSRDMLRGEPEGMAAYRGKDGTMLWSNDVSYGGPCMLHGDTIITNNRYAYSLLTGKQKMHIDPLTGKEKPWMFKRNYGCNYVIASEHLLTFRSAAAGFYDLEHDGGTGNFGGFKSGCTSNLIAANGVLNAPDYTRTCSCSYQNQTSLALVHDPDVEMWTTYFSYPEVSDRIASSSTALALIDLDGNLTYVNSSFLKLWGYDNDSEILSKSALELWQTEEKALQVADALQNQGKWTGKMVGVKKDGSELNLHLSARMVTNESAQPVYIVASFVDITDQTNTENVKHPDFTLNSTRDLNKLFRGYSSIKFLGLNLGAPGDRKADNGTLWLEYPRVGGPSPEIQVDIEPEDYERFCHHSSRIQGNGLKWVVASGLKNVSSMKITLLAKLAEPTAQGDEAEPIESDVQKRSYTVRVYFSEPDEISPGQRVFDVAIQGQKVLENFDIVKEAGSLNRAIVREFKNILVEKDLSLVFTASKTAPKSVPLICGIEILEEGTTDTNETR